MTKQTMLSKAIAFATEKHQGQTRLDGTPYINHPLKVADILRNAGYDVNYQIAAILHDVLEDTDATEDEVREFGDDVLEAVKLVTRLPGTEESDYVNAILTNDMAAAVKNADKTHNVLDAYQSADRDWALRYVEKANIYYYGKFSPSLDRVILSVLPELKNNKL